MKTRNYRVLELNHYEKDEYRLIPLRDEDKYKIMQWRNEQIYHLRQSKPLTIKDQNFYFKNIIAKLFDEEKPTQILFSFLHNEECIGYGGLVHIDWTSLNGEISFIMETLREAQEFELNWSKFLQLIEIVAFEDLDFEKIYTFAYDLRPHLIETIEKCGYIEEATLRNHYRHQEVLCDVKIHSKWRHK